MNSIYLSVVIPCFDEMANLQKGVLDKVEHFLEKKKYTYEVLIVDDGSSDGSAEFVQSFCKESPHFKLIQNPHLGKAGAVTSGMLEAKGEYVLFTDMDQATPIDQVEKLLPFIDKGYDIVIGSRNSTRKGAPWTRLLMSYVWMMLRNFVVNLKGISDTQCGFKLFGKRVSKDIFSKIKKLHAGFQHASGSSVSAAFDVEVLFLAQKAGYKIKEVPVSWLYVETRRVSPLRDSIKSFFDLLAIRKKIASGSYDNL